MYHNSFRAALSASKLASRTYNGLMISMLLSLETHEVLQRIAPEGDIKGLIREMVERILQTT